MMEDASPDEAIVSIMEELRDCPPEQQHAELVAWARSPWWHPLLMVALGWHGELARAAWKALKADLAADTPGRRWDICDPSIGRASIVRLLGLEGNPAAAYAAAAFRTWVDDDDRNWIAAAVGGPAFLDSDEALRWCHLDIRDVILWDPRTNEARVAGEHPDTSSFVMPDQIDTKLTIWGDCRAFFQAWAARRAAAGQLAQRRARGEWAHPISEPADGNLPGGLLVGNCHHARWPLVDASSVYAGAGVTAAELHLAAVRSARLPQFGTA